MEPARHVQHDVVAMLGRSLRDCIAHRVVPQVLRVVEPFLRRAATAAAHVAAHRAIDAFPVGSTRREDLGGQHGALLGAQLVERCLAAAAGEHAAQRAGEVGGDDRDLRLLRGFDQRPVGGLVVLPRAGLVQELAFVDAAGEVVVEHGLHVAFEHLHRQHDLALARAQQLLQHAQFDLVRGVVDVRLTEEHDVELRQPFDQLGPAEPRVGLGVVDARRLLERRQRPRGLCGERCVGQGEERQRGQRRQQRAEGERAVHRRMTRHAVLWCNGPFRPGARRAGSLTAGTA